MSATTTCVHATLTCMHACIVTTSALTDHLLSVQNHAELDNVICIDDSLTCIVHAWALTEHQLPVQNPGDATSRPTDTLAPHRYAYTNH